MNLEVRDVSSVSELSSVNLLNKENSMTVETQRTINKSRVVATCSVDNELLVKHHALIRNAMVTSIVSILHVGQLVYTAKKACNQETFKALAAKFGGMSKVSKFVKIGKRFDALNFYIEALPQKWTSVYQIAQLSDTDLAQNVASGTITPFMTGATANTLNTGVSYSANSSVTVMHVIINANTDYDEIRKTYGEKIDAIRAQWKKDIATLESYGLTIKSEFIDNKPVDLTEHFV